MSRSLLGATKKGDLTFEFIKIILIPTPAQHDVTRLSGIPADPSLRNLHTPISQWRKD